MNFAQLLRARYRICFESRWIAYSSFFAGLAVFLLCAFFFGFKNISQMEGGFLAIFFWMPLVILVAYGILLCGIRIQNPVPYGAAGVLYCILMVIQSCSGGSGNALLSVVWYILAACILAASVLGIFSGRVLVVLMFLLPVLWRLNGIDWPAFSDGNYWGLLPDIAVLSGLLAFSTLGLCMKPVKPAGNKSSQ